MNTNPDLELIDSLVFGKQITSKLVVYYRKGLGIEFALYIKRMKYILLILIVFSAFQAPIMALDSDCCHSEDIALSHDCDMQSMDEDGECTMHTDAEKSESDGKDCSDSGNCHCCHHLSLIQFYESAELSSIVEIFTQGEFGFQSYPISTYTSSIWIPPNV